MNTLQLKKKNVRVQYFIELLVATLLLLCMHSKTLFVKNRFSLELLSY